MRNRRRSKTRNKIAAAVIAFFFGQFGIHHFYLGNKKKGFIFIVLAIFTFGIIPRIISIVELIQYLSMSEEDFDLKYNQEFQEWNYQTRRERRTTRSQTRTARRERRKAPTTRRATRAEDHKVRKSRRRNPEFSRKQRQQRTRVKPGHTHKAEGIRKFKEYDMQGAIIDFEKALKAAPEDPATHFNLACAYSIMENKEESFYHLSRAVKHGFTDFERITTHEALAFMRIQDNWSDFVERRYTLSGDKQQEDNHERHAHSPEESDEVPADLLDQLNKLKDLRNRGLLTDEEFIAQREKLQG